MALDERTNEEFEKTNKAPAPVEERKELSDKLQTENHGSDLEQKTNKFSFGKAAKDFLKFTPWLGLNMYASFLMGAAHAVFLTPLGLGVGRLITNYKKKTKTKYNEMRDLLKIGTFGATLGLAAYTIPDFIVTNTATLGSKLLKALVMNPFMVAPWLAWYRTTNYIVDKYGTKGMLKSFFNFKIFKYVKEAYQNDLKTKLIPQIKETFLTLYPIHIFSMNYVTQPVNRLAIGAGNDVLLSMIAGEEGVLKSLKRRFGRKDKNHSEPKPRLYERLKNGVDNFFKHSDYKPAYGGNK
ncbi:hypothetical protein HQ529_01645 [Candidatus Woesearchaeota archaeon]|nr:hypothetical protein [Candidatus Woesearchaeota archaeon]